MDHEQAVRQNATERYLLKELDPGVRDEFEEHLFDCQDCALDVRAAAMFVEQSKVVLAEPPVVAPVRNPVPVPARAGWLAWMRPTFALPVMALLIVIGYQNLVTVPQLAKSLNQPKVLPALMLNLSSRGSEDAKVTVIRGTPFLLSARIPPAKADSRYTADLYNAKEGLEWSLAIPLSAGEDMVRVTVPTRNLEAGKYTMKIHGIDASGQSTEVGFPTTFELQTGN